jgi:hypothetical protein
MLFGQPAGPKGLNSGRASSSRGTRAVSGFRRGHDADRALHTPSEADRPAWGADNAGRAQHEPDHHADDRGSDILYIDAASSARASSRDNISCSWGAPCPVLCSPRSVARGVDPRSVHRAACRTLRPKRQSARKLIHEGAVMRVSLRSTPRRNSRSYRPRLGPTGHGDRSALDWVLDQHKRETRQVAPASTPIASPTTRSA